ncbi:uncharacterized protein N7529_007214 [Penicillium soppii]|uniref:uncharacterized protein n=1 Tax=Penicillium soppii TaxID=69789 RepID=UPI0025477127|nr:uncharacterized protein N7529_007214 [Penicillium soppii]KAJ5865298.1 hypothetical protein N7529_007214 [Penicillium soppii]
MWEYYENKSVLVTGGSGFLGTAIVHRVLTTTSVSCIYLICRGGIEKLQARWRQWLPHGVVDKLCDPNRLIVFDGDILLPDLGLSIVELDTVRNNASIVIHTASSINLVQPLHRLSNSIIEATEMIAELALTFKTLERFVYVSTAYANTHIYTRSPEWDSKIDEEIYELSTNQSSPLDEFDEVRKNGTSLAYEAENFPWAYAYCKHLAERLLVHLFGDRAAKEKILIIRPSVIGPSQQLPFPGYVMPMSSPCTMLAAALALAPHWHIRIATSMENPSLDAHYDEVPVDVVADRLLCHLAIGSHGCVHAVSGVRSRMRLEAFRQSLTKLRRIPWDLRPVWVAGDWKSPDQHPISRLYGILGTSFAFSEDRTIAMRQALSEKECLDLQLFTEIDMSDHLLTRTEHIRYAMDQFARKSVLAWLIVWLFYSNYGKANCSAQL